MPCVQDICSKNFVQLPSSTSVLDAVTLMTNKNIGSVLVSKDKIVSGVFTERDVLTKVISKDINASVCKLEEVMTKNLITIAGFVRPTAALEIMFKKNIRHLPVVDDNKKVIGLISMRDLLRFVVKDLATINRQMQDELDQLRFLSL